MLDDNDLKCCGTHTGLDQLQGDKFKATVELHKTLGAPFINVPYIPAERFATVEKCKQLGEEFSVLAEKLKSDDLRVGYHAHAGDFKKIDNDTYWDLLFSNTSKDVNMQLDIGNCLDGKGDPYAVLKKFPGRATTVHIKPYGNNNAAFGEDQVRWNEIFELLEKPGKTEWYIVEYEVDAGKTDGVKRCIEGLRKLGKC
jgi:sugar phosphate isomerase/epimerase